MEVVKKEKDQVVVFTPDFVDALHSYLNSKPRAESNEFCNVIEKSPTIDSEVVEDFFKSKEEDKKGKE